MKLWMYCCPPLSDVKYNCKVLYFCISAVQLTLRGEMINAQCLIFSQLSSSVIFQFRNFKIVYRRYAGLYFCICVDISDNNLAYLEAIHNFVEVLNEYFHNVCELDLVFNFYKVRWFFFFFFFFLVSLAFVKQKDLSSESHCGVCLFASLLVCRQRGYFNCDTRWLTRLISKINTRWLSYVIPLLRKRQEQEKWRRRRDTLLTIIPYFASIISVERMVQFIQKRANL